MLVKYITFEFSVSFLCLSARLWTGTYFITKDNLKPVSVLFFSLGFSVSPQFIIVFHGQTPAQAVLVLLRAPAFSPSFEETEKRGSGVC